MSDTASREAFEAAVMLITDFDSSEFTKYESGNYGDPVIADLWRGWKLRDAEIAALKARVEELEGVLYEIDRATMILSGDWLRKFSRQVAKEALR